MKKQLLITVLAVCGLTFGAQSQNSLLWKVISPKGAESHLFGTYHLLGSDYLEENQEVKAAWQNAKTVVVETVVDSSKIMAVMMAGMMPGKSLKEMYSAENYKILKEKLEPALGMDLAMADQMKPLTLSLTYSMRMAAEQTPDTFYFEGKPIDLFLAQQRAKGQDLFPLESMEEQMEILYGSQTLEEQAEYLLQLVKEEEESIAATSQILNAYMEQDLDRMMALSEAFEASYGDLDALIDQRNIKWIEKLELLLNQGGAFIAVGALHLPGKKGLIELLRARGYRVSAVR